MVRKPDHRARIKELSSDLQKSSTFEATAARELTMLLYEQAKEKLVSAEGNEVHKTQGEARALLSLHTRLTVVPMGQKE